MISRNDLRIGVVGFGEVQLRRLFHFHTVDAAAQRDLRRAAALVTAIQLHRQAVVKIRQHGGFRPGHIYAGKLDLQVRGERAHQFLPERARLSREVVARENERSQSVGIFRELFQVKQRQVMNALQAGT